MTTTNITGLIVAALAASLACSSQTFSSATGDAGLAQAGSSNGGASSNTGGSAASAGRSGTGGARASGGSNSGGVNGTGSRPAGGSSGTSNGGTFGSGGGSSSDSGVITVDGGVVPPDSGAVRCTGPDPTFPTFDKGCTSDANCVLARHTTSCCGDQLFMAINHGELARFQAAESICDAQYPGCGCASQGVTAEDGTMVPWGSENMIVASCDNGICRSHYSGQTFRCGTATCTDQQYCSAFTGGPAGSPTSYNCNFLGGCASCSCVSSTGCVCTEDQGFIKVSCAAP